MTGTPFFIEEADGFAPTEACTGYWQSDTISGRVVGGLLGHVLERAYGGPGFMPTRFCVDLLRPPPRAKLRPVLRLLRDGGRLKLGHVDLYAGEVLVAHASSQFLRTTENPTAPTWQTPSWQVPGPHDLPRNDDNPHWDMRPIPPDRRHPPRPAAEVPAGADIAGNPPVLGLMGPFAARQAWVREVRDLVDGAPLTPFTRVALAADFASPLANSGPDSIDYVNSDFTVYLHRAPRSEWLGFDLMKHHSAEGVAIGECWLYDEAGPLGTVTVTGVAQRQR